MKNSLLATASVLAIFAAIRCSEGGAVRGNEPPAEGDAQPCIADGECGDGKRCQLGVCIDASCKRDSDCPSKSCDLLRGVCNPPSDAGGGPTDSGPDAGANDAGPDAGASDAGPDGGLSTCANKYECPNGKICKSSQCVDPTGSCPLGDRDCPRSQICGPAQTCISGCLDNRDCEGSTDGPICDSVATPTYKCGRCHPVDNPCTAGQSCIDEICAATISCTLNTDCPYGLICNGANVCQNCTGNAECGAGKNCNDGHCQASGTGGCSDDTDCDASLGPTSYCDQNNTCQTGQCRDSSHCNVAGGETCDTATHLCTGGGTSTDGGPTTSNTSGPAFGCFDNDDSKCPPEYHCRSSALHTCTLFCDSSNGCNCPAGYGCYLNVAYVLGQKLPCGSLFAECPSGSYPEEQNCYCLP